MNHRDKNILRGLAGRIAQAAALPIQKQRAALWQCSSELAPKRPMVYFNPQNGWAELVTGSMLECEDEGARGIEHGLRQTVFRIDHMPDDFVIRGVYPLNINIQSSGFGLDGRLTQSNQKDGAYHIEPVIHSIQDIQALHFPEIKIDWESTWRSQAFLDDLFGDLLPIELRGIDHCRCGLTRQLVHYRGLDQMLYDLYDNPELFHAAMAFLCDAKLYEFKAYQAMGLLSSNNRKDAFLGSGGMAYNNTLKKHADLQMPNVTMKDMYAWGESQEFTCVGPDQFAEFVLPYQKRVLSEFGLADYGCCEPLDHKINLIIKELPNLRWIAVSPWSNRELAADKIKNNYVYVYKPNPSLLCSESPDYQASFAQVIETIKIAKDSPVVIAMKDTSTFYNQPQRVTHWIENVMKIVQS